MFCHAYCPRVTQYYFCQGYTPLHIAAEQGHEEIIELLINGFSEWCNVFVKYLIIKYFNSCLNNVFINYFFFYHT